MPFLLLLRFNVTSALSAVDAVAGLIVSSYLCIIIPRDGISCASNSSLISKANAVCLLYCAFSGYQSNKNEKLREKAVETSLVQRIMRNAESNGIKIIILNNLLTHLLLFQNAICENKK